MPSPRFKRIALLQLALLGIGVGCRGDRLHDIAVREADAVAPTPSASVRPAERPSVLATESMTDGELRRVFAENPRSMGSVSLGRPSAGALINPTQLSDGPSWIVAYPDNAWATSETIDALKVAFKALPDGRLAYVGDLSLPWGGPLSPHKSHQSGRDVDIGYYRIDDRWWADASAATLDRSRTWALLRALITSTDVEVIFVDKSVQRWLRSHGRSIGEDPRWLDRLFDLGRPEAFGLIRHAPEHRNHLHVRFYNPVAQRLGRVVHDLAIGGFERAPAVRVPPRTTPGR